MIKIDTNRYWSVDAACFSDNCVDLCFLMFSNYNRTNRPFPSWTKHLFQSEAKCDSIGMKMIFYSHTNKTPFESESSLTNVPTTEGLVTLSVAPTLFRHFVKRENSLQPQRKVIFKVPRLRLPTP